MCMCVCVCERERHLCICVCVHTCACVCACSCVHIGDATDLSQWGKKKLKEEVRLVVFLLANQSHILPLSYGGGLQ